MLFVSFFLVLYVSCMDDSWIFRNHTGWSKLILVHQWPVTVCKRTQITQHCTELSRSVPVSMGLTIYQYVLECGRKQEDPEETHTSAERTYKLLTDIDLGPEPRTLELQSCSANSNNL
ncbi:hypothetical protein GDO81_027400 [Engystomops pustulosus]|uniref:Uncharacterized protein n=1 Tax=Engystomops pustulosus TaxID=76066 RepID=A0AAV6ZPH2_ENGPU|nr:hypothetical protein GDO81_027400 [Engystomops pustulosus]